MSDITVSRPANRSLRVIGALVGKDLVDAVRNRQILSLLVMMLFLVGLYRVMPLLTGAGDSPNLLLYDAGASTQIGRLRQAAGLELYVYPGADLLPARMTEYDKAELALVLPADFDQQLMAGETPRLTVTAPYWLAADEAAAAAAEVEAAMTTALGQSVAVTVDPRPVYPPLTAYGPSFILGVTIVVIAGMVGMALVPNLMLEEKLARTMDVLLVSPATPTQIVIAKSVTGIIFMLLLLVPALYFYGQLFVSWWLAALATLLTLLFCTGIGLLVGAWARQRQQTQLAVLILGQPLLVPLFLLIMVDILPAWLVAAFHWIPTVAGMILIRAACTNPLTLGSYVQELGVLIGGTALVLAAVVVVVRRQDRQE